jgi:hypothetical protein
MRKNKTSERSFLASLIYFFPVQLLFVHLKKNLQLLLFWLLLFLIIFNQFGLKYGVPYLFLAPEYLGKLNFWSYLIVGFALGGFIIAFNISSYIMNGFRFPFLATLSKPFLKYSINNSLIPLAFIVSYLVITFRFLHHYEVFSYSEIIFRLMGFLIGCITFVLFSMIYFLATNKSFEKLFGAEVAKVVSSDSETAEPAMLLLNRKKQAWYNRSQFEKTWRVDSYLSGRFKFKYTRSFAHYDQHMLSQVFRQNHINASFFELLVIFSILVLGLFKENPVFVIPAGATVILILTMLIMITSAIRSWIRGWTVVLIIGLLLGINQLSKHYDFYYENRAYGLNYEKKNPYPEKLEFISKEQAAKDRQLTVNMLENWKVKNQTTNKKPKALFISASGGGARAALWSFLALQHLDSISKGELMKHCIMVTGSSGGMIGSAFFRELKWQEQTQGLNPYAAQYGKNLSQDILNPISFTLAVNDILIRTQKFDYEDQSYWKDRGYIFEKVLIDHCGGFFEKKLLDYQEPEQSASIPQFIFTPSIVNDGRRLLISTLPLSFLMETRDGNRSENLDYLSYFKENDPLSIRFSSILRMNSSFPYIMPTVSMPTKPDIEIFDSGLRDNYGIKTSLRYIFELKDWLEKNTSGIVILQIRDGLKGAQLKSKTTNRSMFSELLSPFGSLYGNWFEVQDYNNDELLNYAQSWYSGEVDIINYQLNKSADNYISLSWHLTSKEKEQIQRSISINSNREADKKLLRLLSE